MPFTDDVSPVSLYTSAYGIGGVLLQIVNDVWKPIAFVSKSLTAVQLKWSTIQTEAYAIFICCTQSPGGTSHSKSLNIPSTMFPNPGVNLGNIRNIRMRTRMPECANTLNCYVCKRRRL